MRKLLIVAFLLAGILGAQPTTTTVADTLRLPDVSNITGTVYIRLSHPCEAGDGSRIYSGYPGSAAVTAGAFTVDLVPNDNCADVAGNHSTAYKVQYDVRDANGVKQPTENETWVVPTSGSAVTISDVVTTTWTAPVNYLNLGRLGNYSTKGGMLASNGSAWARLAPDADDYCLITDSTTTLGVRWGSCASGTGVGTVTSVGASAPSTLFTVSGSPVTTAGTLALSFATGQTANRVFGTSAAGAVSLLALTADHLPDLSGTYQPLDAALTALAAGSDFFQVTGPTTSTKVFTLPDANATLLYSGGPLGTPSGGTLTNATGLPIDSGVSGLGSGVATFLATPSSANLAAAVTGETGTGAAVFATSPTLVTPTLGVASATTINKVALTAPATGSTITVADGKTLTVSNTITLTGTDSASVAVGAGGTVAMTADKLSAFAATTSAELSSVLSDENTSGGYFTNPMLTTDDVIVGNASGVPKRLAKGSEGQVLKVTSGAVAWSTDSTGGTPAFSDVASGTNTAAAMVVGTGASLGATGSGTITATSAATATTASTASALAANGANCSAGQYPLGVDASGAAESCTADDTGTDTLDDLSDDALGALQNVTEATPANDDVLQYVTDHWENQTLAEAGIQAALSLASGVETWLGTPSSANLATALTDEVGNAGGFTRGTAGSTDDCAKWDASGNLVSAGAACGTGGGTPAGSDLDYQYNNSGAFGGATLKECGSGVVGIGGCTSSSPGIKANGTYVEIVLADNSLYAGTTALVFNVANDYAFGGSTIYDADKFVLPSYAGDPGTPANGWMVYNSTANKFRCYENGAWADCIGAGSGGYATIDDEDTPLTQRTTLNFEGGGVTCADDTDQTTCTIPAGSLPTQTGNANKLLSTNATDADWRAIGAGLIVDATSVRVDDSAVVMATGTQTVAGDKTFTGDTAVTGDVDFSGSTATQACQSGATPPGTCAANSECFIDTDDEQFLICDSAGTGWDPYASASAGSGVVGIQIVIDGGGAEIATGVHGDVEVPFACTITQVTGLADQSGSIVVDIWKDAYANYPPTDADSITASAPLTLSTAVKAQDATLTGWTTSISAGDTLRYNVDSVTTIERLTVSLKCTR